MNRKIVSTPNHTEAAMIIAFSNRLLDSKYTVKKNDTLEIPKKSQNHIVCSNWNMLLMWKKTYMLMRIEIERKIKVNIRN